jgi:transcriptional regulator with XRE-family HTH domain
VSRWESGFNHPDGRFLRGLARELGVSVTWLLGESEPSDEDELAGAAA